MVDIQFRYDDCTVANRWAKAATTVDARNGARCALASVRDTGTPNKLGGDGNVTLCCWLDGGSSCEEAVARRRRERNCIFIVGGGESGKFWVHISFCNLMGACLVHLH